MEHGNGPRVRRLAEPRLGPGSGGGASVIHAVAVGGGILALAPLPGDGGDYHGDLDHIASWAPAFLLTLALPEELFAAGAMTLGQDIQDRGSRWLHLPVRAGDTPDPAFTRSWPEASARMRRALIGGGRVLVHGRGGHGRSGMVALRLMIETGEVPDTALARLRAIRPGAVATRAQLDWARAVRRETPRGPRPPV